MSLSSAFDAPATQGSGVMIIPRWDEGDFRVEWNKDKESEVTAARDQFVKLKAQGYKCYRVDPKSSERGELIKEFDPKAEKLVMIPAFAGG